MRSPGRALRIAVVLGLPELAPGGYEVRWTTLSTEDGELERGTWSFKVTAAATAVPTPTQAPTAGSTTLTLWSLGQTIVVTPEESAAFQTVSTTRG